MRGSRSWAIGAPQWLPALLRIDYIWHSAEFVTLSHRVAGPLGSDHLPVMAVLAWVEAGSRYYPVAME